MTYIYTSALNFTKHFSIHYSFEVELALNAFQKTEAMSEKDESMIYVQTTGDFFFRCCLTSITTHWKDQTWSCCKVLQFCLSTICLHINVLHEIITAACVNVGLTVLSFVSDRAVYHVPPPEP